MAGVVGIEYDYGNITRVEVDMNSLIRFSRASDEGQHIYPILRLTFDEEDRIDPGTNAPRIDPGTNFSFTLLKFPWYIHNPHAKFAVNVTEAFGAGGYPEDRICIYFRTRSTVSA
ncbi:unnamed protein product [Arabidopsis thaliana]|uniref:Uncharacterized protein n=1 Tax=Arabidopsis thaliana TaxID=3702 RepID=A0A654EFB1_ARATH|nr:unnamed protein product [Arabidopsis thaliana]